MYYFCAQKAAILISYEVTRLVDYYVIYNFPTNTDCYYVIAPDWQISLSHHGPCAGMACHAHDGRGENCLVITTTHTQNSGGAKVCFGKLSIILHNDSVSGFIFKS